jgi:hypothetical protein
MGGQNWVTGIGAGACVTTYVIFLREEDSTISHYNGRDAHSPLRVS